jgi:hypothetical protein
LTNPNLFRDGWVAPRGIEFWLLLDSRPLLLIRQRRGAGAAVPVEAGDMLPHFLFGLGALPAQFFRIKLNNNPCLQENVGALFCARARGHNA